MCAVERMKVPGLAANRFSLRISLRSQEKRHLPVFTDFKAATF